MAMRHLTTFLVTCTLAGGGRRLACPDQAAAAATGVAGTEYLCRATAQAPVIDGLLSDPCWASAQDSPAFHPIGPHAAAEPSRMQVRFACDSENLYVALDALSRPGSVPRAQEARLRDGPVFGDESVELFLRTSPTARETYQLVVNCGNAIYDAHDVPDARAEENPGPKWDPEWQHATKTRPGGWTAEIALPFRAFGVEAPRQGFVWRVQVGHNAPNQPHEMWPRNPTPSFPAPGHAGSLIFRDRNLLTNGDVEGPVNSKGVPEGWGFSYNDKEGTGVIKAWETDAAQGKRMIRYEKTTPEMWFPQLWLAPFAIQPHSTYRYSFLVNSEKPFVMRHSLFAEGGARTRKFSEGQEATRGFEPREVTFRVEDEGPDAAIGIQLSQRAGVMWVDDARIERVNGVEFTRVEPPLAHCCHRLERLAARRPFKPYAQVTEGDPIQSERVIFRDTGTGAWVWRVTDTPGGSTRHYYMEACPWNGDGSRLLLSSSEWDLREDRLLPADCSTMTRPPVWTSWFAWDRKDPNRLYYCKPLEGDDTKSGAFTYSYATGEDKLLKTFAGSANAWVLSQDNKYLLLKEYFPEAPLEKRTMVHLLSLDGKEDLVLDPKGQIHQLWFTKLPDHSVEFEYEHGGFKPGDYLEGNFVMKKDGTLSRIYGGEATWAGHRAHSPSGKRMCPIGRLQVVNKLTGELTSLGSGSSNHQSWETDDSWLAASSGYDLIRFAADGRDFVERLGSHNSGIGHSTYWTEAHPAMSPDGTKLGYASSMLGDLDFHFLVMGLPGRPEALQATRQGDRVALRWQPPKHAKEILGYHVYRSSRSGSGFEQLTTKPVPECSFTDTPPRGRPVYYTVTSLERCGLESLRSQEVCTDPEWPGPLVRVFEAEHARVTAPPAMEAFDPTAAGFYCLNLGQNKAAEEVLLPFDVPRSGTFALWLRVMSADNDFVLLTGPDQAHLTETTGDKGPWRWVKVGDGAKLARGEQRLFLRANVPYVLVDQLVVTDDASVRLVDAADADTASPTAPTELHVEATGSYSAKLTWHAVEALDLHHYNVYLSESPDCPAVQENLLASPSSLSYVAWGLRAGTKYYCRVTAVDRAGNESATPAAAEVSTTPIPRRLFAQFDQQWRSTERRQTEVAFECPEDTNVVLWTKWQSLDPDKQGTGGRFDVGFDGGPASPQAIRFGYLCLGHGGPVAGDWLWNWSAPLNKGEKTPGFGFHLSKGKHTMQLSVPAEADLECGGILVTRDFGFLPTDGYTSFLPLTGKAE